MAPRQLVARTGALGEALAVGEAHSGKRPLAIKAVRQQGRAEGGIRGTSGLDWICTAGDQVRYPFGQIRGGPASVELIGLRNRPAPKQAHHVIIS